MSDTFDNQKPFGTQIDPPFQPVPVQTVRPTPPPVAPVVSKPVAKTVPADKPDGPTEHFIAIHYLLNQMRAEKQSSATLATLDKITGRLDLIEGKPEAVEAEKRRLDELEAARVEKARVEEKAKEDAKTA